MLRVCLHVALLASKLTRLRYWGRINGVSGVFPMPLFFFFFFSSRSFISLCMSLSAQCLFLLCNRAQNRPLFLLPPLRSLDCLKTFHNFGFEPTICCPVVSAWKGHLLIDPPFKSFLPIVENLNLRLQVQHEHLLQLCAPFLLWPIFCPHGIVR